MTQDERWQEKYEEVVGFIMANHWNPSKHRVEEYLMLNWIKANRKVMNVGKLKQERVKLFERLLELVEENKRVNQWK